MKKLLILLILCNLTLCAFSRPIYIDTNGTGDYPTIQAAIEVEKDAASASALGYHNNKISKFSIKNLKQTFSDLSKTNCVPSDLKELFDKAEKYYSEKIQ